MPKFFKQNLLSSNLDTPELPKDEAQAEEWIEQSEHIHTEPVQHTQEYHQDELDPVRELLSWQAPSRPFRKRDRSFYTTVAVLIILVSLIALLANQIMLIGVLLALLF